MAASVLVELARMSGKIRENREDNLRHPLASVVAMAVVAVLCGADSWNAVASFARIEEKWFGLFLPMRHGVPSRQTFQRVFALIKPEQMEKMLRVWFRLMSRQSSGAIRQLAMDGKALRRSFKHVWDSSSMAYLVSAFATENGLAMAQTEATRGRGGELGAIRRLLKQLELKGVMVTIDAGGCHRDVAETIIDGGGDYCLAVKDNQRSLHGHIRILFNQVRKGEEGAARVQVHQTVERGHGRQETRKVWVSSQVQRLGEAAKRWKGLAAVAMVESCRQVGKEKPSYNWRYYILSKASAAEEVQKIIRGHWGIENKLHYVLDVGYGEDGSRIEKASATNFSRLRRLTLNMLQSEKSFKGSLIGKRQACGWSREYRVKVLAASLGMST